MRYRDRGHAGRELAKALTIHPGTLALALPRGGVPIAAEIATHHHLELDLLLVKKIPAPGNPEVAAGAVARVGGTTRKVWNHSVLFALGRRPADLTQELERAVAELHVREQTYRAGRGPQDIPGRDVLLIDDGIATGATMRAAVQALQGTARSIHVAVPVASREAVAELRALGAEVTCPHIPGNFNTVSEAYEHYPQVTDPEKLLTHQKQQPAN